MKRNFQFFTFLLLTLMSIEENNLVATVISYVLNILGIFNPKE